MLGQDTDGLGPPPTVHPRNQMQLRPHAGFLLLYQTVCACICVCVCVGGWGEAEDIDPYAYAFVHVAQGGLTLLKAPRWQKPFYSGIWATPRSLNSLSQPPHVGSSWDLYSTEPALSLGPLPSPYMFKHLSSLHAHSHSANWVMRFLA